MDLQVIRRQLGERLAGPRVVAAASLVNRHALWFALAISAYYAVHLGRMAVRRFWFDELFTFHISRLPQLDQLFQALPADGNPPLSHLLVRLCMQLFGETEFVARLPSIVAFVWAMLAAYLFVRRRCLPIAAVLAVFAFASSKIGAYGTAARPYALMLGFTALALVSWQAATEPGRRRLLPLIGIVLGIAGAIGCHHYGVFHVAAPLAVGEVVRLKQRRRLDLPLYAAGLAGLATIALTLPFALATDRVMLIYTRASSVFGHKPTLSSFLTYGDMVSPWLVGVLLALLWLTRPAFEPAETEPQNRLPAHEIAAAAGLALLTPIMIALTWATTGYYGQRYAISTMLGVAILLGFAVQRFSVTAKQGMVVAALSMAVLTAGYVVPRATAIAWHKVDPSSAPSEPSSASIFDKAPAGEPIVVANPVEFMADWWYAPPDLRQRLHYLADMPYATTQPFFLADVSLVVNRDVIPEKTDDYATFLKTHRRFALYCWGPDDGNWIKGRLIAAGWTLTPLYDDGVRALFDARAP